MEKSLRIISEIILIFENCIVLMFINLVRCLMVDQERFITERTFLRRDLS